MTSAPLSQCCAIGTLHEGTPKGEIKDIGKISTYFSYPPNKSTSNALLLLTDVIGHKFANAQLIADQFAVHGYFVVVPDLFDGDTVPLNPQPGFDFMEWLKPHMPPNVEPIIDEVLAEMRGPLGCKKIGGVGYCFGGKYATRYLKKGKLDVVYIAHPAMLDPEELKAIEGPLSLAAASKDGMFAGAQRHACEEVLSGLSYPYQISLYSDVDHGFAVRSDISQSREKFAKEQAFGQAVSWFNEYLKV